MKKHPRTLSHRCLLFAVVLTLAGAAGCKEEAARSLVPIDVTADGDIGNLRQVKIVLGNGTAEYVNRTVAWPQSKLLQVAFHLSADIAGTVTVLALGLDENGTTVTETARGEVMVTAGATAMLVKLHLTRQIGTTDSDAGTQPDADGSSDASPGHTPDGAVSTTDAVQDTTPVVTPDAPVRMWMPGENLQKDDLHGSTYDPDVAIDPDQGHVLAAWSGDGVVTVRRFDGQTMKWGSLQTIETAGDPSGARIALGSNGQALLVWYQYDPDGTAPLRGLWESHSGDGGKKWSTPLRVQMDWVWEIELAMSPTGEARVAWEVYENKPTLNYPAVALWSATYQASTGLFANVALVKASGDDTTNREPRLTMDRAGNGMLAWQQLDTAGQESVWATGFSGAQPLNPQLLDTNTTDRIFTHNVAIAPEGNKGMVVWSETSGANDWLMFNEYDTGVWAGPHRELSSGSFGGPAVAIDGAGVVTAAWSQGTGTGYNVVAARRTPGAGWSAGVPLETTSVAKADSGEWAEPHLAVGGDNKVHAAWRRRTSTTKVSFDVVVRRFANGMWEPETVLGHRDTFRTYHPRLVVANDGRAALAFYFFTFIRDPDPTETEGYRTFVSLYR